MNQYSAHESGRFSASPYEQLEPPFYLLPGEGSFFAAIVQPVKRLFHCCTDAMLAARTATALSHLDDSRLRDIGIRRDEIHAVARRTVEDLRKSS